MAEALTDNQLNYQRSKAVSQAWEHERELVSKGRGTRQWTLSEQKELLKTGRVKGYQGHHMKSVSYHPEYAGDSKNIQFLDSRKGHNEHLKAHKGDYRNESDGRYQVKTGKIRPMSDGKPRAMKSQELETKAIETRGYRKYADDSVKQHISKTESIRSSMDGKHYERAMVKTSETHSQPEEAAVPAEKAGNYTQNAGLSTDSSKANGNYSSIAAANHSQSSSSEAESKGGQSASQTHSGTGHGSSASTGSNHGDSGGHGASGSSDGHGSGGHGASGSSGDHGSGGHTR